MVLGCAWELRAQLFLEFGSKSNPVRSTIRSAAARRLPCGLPSGKTSTFRLGKVNNRFIEWFACVRRLSSSRYVRMLEDELARERAEIERERALSDRLRLENRALLNSLLGTAGVPPVEEPRAQPQGVLPVRRRSWPQIAASRESEAQRQARSDLIGARARRDL